MIDRRKFISDLEMLKDFPPNLPTSANVLCVYDYITNLVS